MKLHVTKTFNESQIEKETLDLDDPKISVDIEDEHGTRMNMLVFTRHVEKLVKEAVSVAEILTQMAPK
jgi:hypothetical protein